MCNFGTVKTRYSSFIFQFSSLFSGLSITDFGLFSTFTFICIQLINIRLCHLNP